MPAASFFRMGRSLSEKHLCVSLCVCVCVCWVRVCVYMFWSVFFPLQSLSDGRTVKGTKSDNLTQDFQHFLPSSSKELVKL